MISSNPSPMVYFSRLAAFNDAVRRFSKVRFQEREGVKAGDPDDCGHERHGGLFDEENDCAAGGRERMVILQESWKREGGPVPDKLRGFYEKHGMLPGEYWEYMDEHEQAEMDRLNDGKGILDKDLPPEYRDILSNYERAGIDTPEREHAFIDLADRAVNNEYGYLPTVEELIVMAQIGRSVKGQYAAAHRIMSEMFGEAVAKTWAAANAILSPNTPWQVHTRASLRVIEEWVKAGAPVGDSPDTIKALGDIIDNVQKEYLIGLGKYPEKGVSANMAIMGKSEEKPGKRHKKKKGRRKKNTENRKKKLINLLSKHGQEITEGMIAASGRKAKEFGQAFYDPTRVAIDTWMTTLGVPVPDGKFPEKSYHQLGELVRNSLRKGDLKHLPKSVQKTVKYIKDIRSNLMNHPEKSAAYKVAVTKAAEAMGVEPREVQEMAWAATMAIAMLKKGGLKDSEIIPNLTHKLVKESWDMEGVFKDANVQAGLRGAGVSEAVLANISSTPWPSGKVGVRVPTEGPGEGEGQIHLTARAREIAEHIVTRIPRADIKTVEGRKLYVPGEGGRGVKVHTQFRRRPRRFDRNPLSCISDETVHGPATHSSRYLSSEQVGSVIADQYHRRLKHDTSQDMQHKFVSSTLFELRKVPSWVLSPYRPIQRGQKSHSQGPIIVDRNKTGLRHRFGSFGQDLSVVILDGKHRRNEHVQEHGDSELECYVGIEVVPIIREYLETFAPLRAAFVEALDNFYNDHNSPAWHGLIDAGRKVGLSDSQLRHLYKSFREGRQFSPPLGTFIQTLISR